FCVEQENTPEAENSSPLLFLLREMARRLSFRRACRASVESLLVRVIFQKQSYCFLLLRLLRKNWVADCNTPIGHFMTARWPPSRRHCPRKSLNVAGNKGAISAQKLRSERLSVRSPSLFGWSSRGSYKGVTL